MQSNLRDHFRPPLVETRPWSGIHSAWASALASQLNGVLPDGWFCGFHVQWDRETDVPVFEDVTVSRGSNAEAIDEVGGAAVSAPTRQISVTASRDLCEVRIYREDSPIELVGAIELVSPGNKDRHRSREAFAVKCASMIESGIGVLVVDVVTTRLPSLHRDILALFDDVDGEADPLYASSYSLSRTDSDDQLSIWYESLKVGAKLPSIPLALKDGPTINCDLSGSYESALVAFRVPDIDANSN